MTDTVEGLDATRQETSADGGPPIRVIFAKGGLDAHERGAHVVVLGLREAGFEVVYMGLRRTPEEVVRAAVQEDADVIGVSSLSGGHRGFVQRIIELLREADAHPVIVVGGLIPEEDQPAMLQAGVDRIFGQGALVSDIAEFLHGAVAERRRARD